MKLLTYPNFTTNTKTLQAAMKYAGKGWHVIRVKYRDKIPVDKQWPEIATTDPETIKRWFSTPMNIGVATGLKSGFWVLDVDGEEGVETLRDLEKNYSIKLPETVVQITGGGGYHYLFKYDERVTKGSVRAITGIDIRTDGNQIVVYPSIHPNGWQYQWELDSADEIAAAPERLIELLLAKQKGEASSTAYVSTEIKEGERNATLASLAGSMRRRGMGQPAIVAALMEENKKCIPPLPEDEVKKVSASVSRYEPESTNNKPAAVKTEWPEPEPINETLLPVEQLPAGIIPGPFREWVVDVSHRMQCPVDFVAVAVMVMAGAVIGAGCGIRPKQKDDWQVVPNLWGGVVGKPGTLKTPSLHEALKPLSRLEAEAKDQYDDDLKYYEGCREVFKARKESIKAAMIAEAKGKGKNPGKDMAVLQVEFTELEEPEAPAWRRYKSNDSTIEKMHELVEQSDRGILLFRDELIGLLSSWDREGREADRAFYLEAWNGLGGHTSDRIGRGTIHVKNLCVSVLGGIQPAKLLAYLYQATSDLENDGLIQRMQLMVFPDEPNNWQLVDEYPFKAAKERVFGVIEKLARMDFIQHGAEEDKIPFFRFNNEAQQLFYEWLTDLQKKLQSDETPVILEHLNKYRSLMPSLALIDHLVNAANGTASGQVPLESAERAAAWCEYLESHARRIYGLVGDIGQRAAGELAKKIKAKKLMDKFTVRDVYRNQWHLLTDKETVQAACEELIEANWLRKEKKEIPGRQPATGYGINPKILAETPGHQADQADTGQ